MSNQNCSLYRVKLLPSSSEAHCWWERVWSPLHSFPTFTFYSSFISLTLVLDPFRVGAPKSKKRSEEKESYSWRLLSRVPQHCAFCSSQAGYPHQLCMGLWELPSPIFLCFWTTGIQFYSSLPQPWGSWLCLQLLSDGICFVFISSLLHTWPDLVYHKYCCMYYLDNFVVVKATPHSDLACASLSTQSVSTFLTH